MLSVLPATLGIAGYVAPIVVITAGYALFQTANNTAVMTDIGPDQRGVISGMLNLSRNLGLITGASVMGAVFAFASATTDITTARPEAVATGMRITFAVAAALIVVALAIAAGAYRRTLRERVLASVSASRCGRPGACTDRPPSGTERQSIPGHAGPDAMNQGTQLVLDVCPSPEAAVRQ